MFESLFSPLQVGPVTLSNRIQITPHELQYLEGGLSTETLEGYYLERARGGAGLLELSQLVIKPFIGIQNADWKYDSARRFPLVNEPGIVPGLTKLSEMVHRYDSKIFMEVSAWAGIHGPVSGMPFNNGMQFKELDLSDIREIQEDFGRASTYVREAGFDGVDLHGTHGALIEHFYSPATNRRKDRYGGSVENRLRFLFEVVEVVRGSVGDSLAVGMRLCADEKIEQGVTPEYAAKMAGLLDGVIDFVNVGSGSSHYFEALNQSAHQAEPLYARFGHGIHLATAVRSAVRKTKVGAVGRITDPLLADEAIRQGSADYVGMTRALIADPELPRKAREGRLDEIRPCIGTMQDCWGRSVAHDWPMRCTVNPAVGREKERGAGVLRPATKKKKVLVVGSGPAGLEAARVASERGHEVVIYERGRTLGGQVNLARMLPGRADIGAILPWYEGQLMKSKVRVEFGVEVMPTTGAIERLLQKERPDAIVLAIGSSPIKSGLQMMTYREVPGWDRPNVLTVDDAVGGKRVEGRVIVADSTTYIDGPGTAELLARRGAEVTLVTPHPHLSPLLSDYNQLIYMVTRLHEAGVKTHTLSWITRISEGSVSVYHIPQATTEELQTDYVVLNTGRQRNTPELRDALRKLVREVYEIGDCDKAGGTMRDAIESGYQVGSSI